MRGGGFLFTKRMFASGLWTPDKLSELKFNGRNVAIIAHVDHGKTTLVDKLFEQSGTALGLKSQERALDFNDLEKERGITIFAKNAAVIWKEHKINIIDTPGHADFGGEVERVLSMADGVLLLVDASEGPMPQTRFVTTKAFNQGLRPIVVVNKMDKTSARPDEVLDEVFQLFDSLGATEEQLDFPILFASAANGWASKSADKGGKNLHVLLDAIIEHVPPPNVDQSGSFQFQVTSLDYSSYLGGIAIGKIRRGSIEAGKDVAVVRADSDEVRKGKVQQIHTFLGMDRVEASIAGAGDLVAMSGIESPSISDTWTDPETPEPLPLLSVDEPTLSCTFEVNTSPLQGKEGHLITSRQLRERLMKETLTNVALKVEETTGGTAGGAFKVSGRGEMHLGILIETMRREGFELGIGRPSVIKKTIDGVLHEPFELVYLDVEEGHENYVMEQMGLRGGTMNSMDYLGGRVQLEFMISTTALIGFRSEFLLHTGGTGIIYQAFDSYRPAQKAPKSQRMTGVLISKSTGQATAYAIDKLQSRGKMFIEPNDHLYEGMIIGLHVAGDNDLTVNAVRGKQLTNMRAAGSDDAIVLQNPIKMTLERAIQFIEDDELVEVTPQNIRVRKKEMDENKRLSKKKNKD